MTKWSVKIRNFDTKEWVIMKLRYDPRTGKEGVAVYDNEEDAGDLMELAMAMSPVVIKVKVEEEAE